MNEPNDDSSRSSPPPSGDPLAGDLVERYLLGQLSEAEAQAFEEYLLVHPEAAAAVEDAERLRRGLRVVEAEDAAAAPPATPPGKVAPLRRPGWRRWAAPLAAAALLAVALGPRLFAPRPAGEKPPGGPPPPVREIVLAQLRGQPGDGPVLTLGDARELLLFSLEKSAEFPGPFRFSLRRDGAVLMTKDGLLADPRRPLTIGIYGGSLTPGPLELVVETMDTPPRPVGRYSVLIEPAPAPSASRDGGR